MQSILARIRTEPALVTGIVTAVVSLVVAFGIPISADQKAAVVGVVAAVLALLGAGTTRHVVTPVAPREYVNGNAQAVPLVAPLDEEDWDPAEHPRDARGRFIDEP